jgi:hypothetical protein
MSDLKHPRGLTDRLLTSDLLQAFGLDALLLVAVVLLGVSVYRFSPDLVWGYAGALLIVTWVAIGRSQRGGRGGREGAEDLMFSERLFERRGEEIANTGGFSSPSVSLLSALGGGPTTSGVRINETTA